jgi:hypothetical protein
MKKIFAVALVAALAMFAGSAYANFCARDVVPASTLLVPYAVQSMNGPLVNAAGYATLLSVTNTSHEAQIIHVTVWNAVSEGVIDFDEVLSGYDVWVINFKDLLSGNWSAFDTSLAASAYPNSETTTLKRAPFEWGPDGRSAYGGITGAPYSNPCAYATGGYVTGLPCPQKTSILPSGNCFLPYGNAVGAIYGPLAVSRIQEPIFSRVHLGCGSQVVARHTSDWLSTLTDNPAFFYVTVDVVNVCNRAFPFDPGYFTTIYLHENVLIGEIYYINETTKYSEATPAVHIESDMDSNLATATSEFYFPKNKSATYLEPLATAFGFKYYASPAFSSSAIVWKNFWEFDDLLTWNDDVLDCGSYVYYAWDEDEHVVTRGQVCPVSPCFGGDIDPNEFPFETQLVALNTAHFDLPAQAGWMLLVFPPSYDAGFWTANGDPTPNLTLLNRNYQAWVATRLEFGGMYSAGLEAATMANAHCFPDQILPNLGNNYENWGHYAQGWWDIDNPAE